MSIIRIGFWGLVAACLVVLGFANRELVTLHILPGGMGQMLGMPEVRPVPLFIPIFVGVALGLLVGFVWEWLREAKERAQARAQRRELERLRAEVARLKAQKHEGKDEVLALLEQAS